MNHSVAWSKISCIGVPEEYVPGGNMLQLLSFDFVLEKRPIFQKRYDGIPPPRGRIQTQDFLIRFVNAWLREVFDRNRTSELEVDG